jgi:hypothetical protein
VSAPRAGEIGTVTDARGRSVTVGASGGKVTLRTLRTRTRGAVELDGDLAEDFAQVYIAAVWQAAQQEARMPGGIEAS